MQSLLLFLFGAALGSAGNALIDRLPRNESWVKGRSHCDKCKQVLAWYDLLPIFSYISLGGKCRYCHSPIPVRNLIVEVLMGGIAILNLKFEILNQFTIIQFLTIWVTIVIAVMDWETKLVSEWLIVVWAILSLFFGFDIYGLLVSLGLIGGIWALSRGKAMGFGDVEIAAVMGFSLGFSKALVAFWMAFVSGAIVGLVLIIVNKAKGRTAIAFGPFLIFGYWIAYFYGEILLKYFLGYV